MTDYGITKDGYKAKRLANIKLEIEEELRAAFGSAINLLPSEFLGQMVGIMSDRFSKLWELSEANYNSQYPETSEKVPLDNVVSITGITRNPGIKSKVIEHFLGTPGTIIPAESFFFVENKPTSRFVLKSPLTIGPGQNEIQKINYSDIPDAGEFKVKIDTETTVVIAFNATAADVRTAVLGLSSLSSVQVTGDFALGFTIEFDGADGLKNWSTIEIVDNTLEKSSNPVTTNIVINQEGFPNRVIGTLEAEVDGEIAAPSTTLNQIENPIAGLDSVFNPGDAVLGREIESDADLKARRAESLQRAGAGTLGALISNLADLDDVLAVVGFENITFIVDGSGRPPKSFEMVVDGGDEDEIAELIWENKPAGIEPDGDITKGIIDSQGFAQNVKFSRPSDADIYLEMDFVTDENFPEDGLDQAETAILAFGNDLAIGQDVVIYPQLISILAFLPGLLDIVTRIGKTVSPTNDNNVIIASDEKSRWDSSRIILTN